MRLTIERIEWPGSRESSALSITATTTRKHAHENSEADSEIEAVHGRWHPGVGVWSLPSPAPQLATLMRQGPGTYTVCLITSEAELTEAVRRPVRSVPADTEEVGHGCPSTSSVRPRVLALPSVRCWKHLRIAVPLLDIRRAAYSFLVS